MKILFVFTGGTIGSVERNGVADTDDSTKEKIAEYFGEPKENLAFASPYNILSENATCDTLTDIVNYMLSVDYDSYDGVVVTHGSDTLAYTAATLGAVLSWVKIPVVITAANFVMTDARSNAKDNLSAARAFIHGYRGGGAFVVWKNDNEKAKVYRAEALLEADGALDRFESWGGEVQGIAENGEYTNIMPVCECRDEYEYLKEKEIRIENNVVLLHSYVGMDYGTVRLDGKKAVLLKLYHSATACMEGGRNSLRYLAEECKREGVELYIAPMKKGRYVYKTATEFERMGVREIYGKSEIAAYTELLIKYSKVFAKPFSKGLPAER